MKRHIYYLLPALTSLFLFLTSIYAQENSAGIVNFTTCITDSKYGKQEQETFDDARKKFMSIITDLEGQITEITNKLQDPEIVDSLSPEAQQDMESRSELLKEEFARCQNHYYQAVNQAQMQLIQLMTTHVAEAAASIAKEQKLSVILNKEACFYYEPKQDITTAVIEKMDKNFEKDVRAENKTATPEKLPEKILN